MKYSVEIEINLPVDRVVELFDNPANMKHWMPNLASSELISGVQGQPGAKTRLKYLRGKRESEMIETVTVRKLPAEFSGSYEFQGMTFLISNHFEALPGDKTRYFLEQDFQLKGFMKLMGWLMPGIFKKESMKHATLFKRFAEGQGLK